MYSTYAQGCTMFVGTSALFAYLRTQAEVCFRQGKRCRRFDSWTHLCYYSAWWKVYERGWVNESATARLNQHADTTGDMTNGIFYRDQISHFMEYVLSYLTPPCVNFPSCTVTAPPAAPHKRHEPRGGFRPRTVAGARPWPTVCSQFGGPLS